MRTHLPIIKWSDTQEEVWKTVLTYTNLILEGKEDEFLEYIHEEYSGWNNIEPIPADKQSIVNELNSGISCSLKGSYNIIPIKIKILEDIAIAHYYLKLETKTHDNSIIKHYTDVLIKSDTRWVLIADHFGEQKNYRLDNLNLQKDC